MAYECVTTREHLAKWIARLERSKLFAIDTETTGKDPMKCDLVGVCLSVVEDGRTPASYIPVGHTEKACQGVEQLPLQYVLDAIRPYTEDKARQKILQNAIYDMTVLGRYDVEFVNVDDTMWMSYCLTAGSTGHSMDEIAELYLNHRTIKFGEVVLEHPLIEMKGFQDVQLHHATHYAAEDTEVTLRLFLDLRRRLKAAGLWTLYQTIDRPLIPAGADMKRNGIAISKKACDRLTREWSPIVEAAAIEVQKYAPGINVGSTQQVQKLLFETLGLPVLETTDSGAPSTGIETLKLLADEHEAVAALVKHRKYTKLIGTYSQALPELINPDTGRLHPSMNFTFTNTGRLSCSDGLHGIPSPAKGEEGVELRKAFCTAKGYKIVAADYSQIELRILAHVTEDKVLCQAFHEGQDIHTRTAGEIWEHDYAHMRWVLEEDENGHPLRADHPEFRIFKNLRRNAKTINFLLVYGGSAYGLARQLKIDEDTAQAFIDKYFEKMTGVTGWMQRIRTSGRRDRFVETVFGRRLYTTDGHSRRETAYAERQAANYVIQGSAADLIRAAMGDVRQALIDEKLDAAMLLQVHDELLFEAGDPHAERTRVLVAEKMAKAGGIDWLVPILVDAKVGATWADAH